MDRPAAGGDGNGRSVAPTARALVDALYAATPVPPGCRVNHARGILVEGHFRPSRLAAALSGAAPFARGTSPALVRFSSSSGDPGIDQRDPRGDPRGMALRIGDPADLALVGHSVEAFPARDGEEFLAFLAALAEGPAGMARHLREHPAAMRFQAARPPEPPASFAAGTYHMLHAYRLGGGDRPDTVGRLTVSGTGGGSAPTPGEPTADHLDEELRRRLDAGPVEMALSITPAPAGVDAADVSVPWPAPEGAVGLGLLVLERIAAEQRAQERLTFDPSTLPEGISFAGDPMVGTRLAAYRLAFERRLR